MLHRITLLLLLTSALVFSFIPAAFAQTRSQTGETSPQTLDSLHAAARAALEQARTDQLPLLSPRHFSRAQDAFREAQSLMERKSDASLIRIKLISCLDELASAQQAADTAREKLGEALSARTAAQAAGADTLSPGLWRNAEERFRGLVHDAERSANSVAAAEVSDVAGGYRAARRDALRSGILSEARARIEEIEKRGGNRLVPSLVLRAHQAISRAEADLAQENLDAARGEAQTALRITAHARALMDYIGRAQDAKQPFEAALLPYDDLLAEIAAHLGGTLDLSRPGVEAGRDILPLIDARQESLATQVVGQQETLKSLETALAEAQTDLVDAQSHIAELENRLRNLEGERSTARETVARTTEMSGRIQRAQQQFNAGEADILQNPDGSVVIRLTGIKYNSGATNLDKTRRRIVDRAVEAIRQFPGASIRVEGHTDSQGGADANQRLSLARAQAVADYLGDKLKQDVMAEGYGETRPLASNDSAAGRTQNRRIELILTLPR